MSEMDTEQYPKIRRFIFGVIVPVAFFIFCAFILFWSVL